VLRFLRDRVIAEDDLRTLIGSHGFTIANLSCRQTDGGQCFEYRMTIKSRNRKNAERLAAHLRSLPEVVEFRIAPTGD
jgi:putative Mg2+ transporter-C (MgtC) family protein